MQNNRKLIKKFVYSSIIDVDKFSAGINFL